MTLLVLTILTVIVLAFLQSMSLERKTAASYSNILRAQMAAEAGVADATTLLQGLFLEYPDSATAWQANMAPASVAVQTPGTAFFYYDEVSVTNTNSATMPVMYYRPLVSGVRSNVEATNRATALANYAGLSNYVNINATNADGSPTWVGLPPGTSNFPISVPWVEMTGAGTNTNVISRYAYWVDDESFRVNVGTATNALRGRTSMGTNATEIPMQQAIFAVLSDAVESGRLATNIANLRTNAAFVDGLRSVRNINYADSAYTNLADRVGFLTTVWSSGLNVSRTGARRVNLNAIVATNTSPTNTTEVRDELLSIIATITNQAPRFGQRFYRTAAANTNTPGVTNEIVYLYKLAANIRDYIDQDSQPTVVMKGGGVYSAGEPNMAISDAGSENEVWAIGKENVPRLQEAVFHAPQRVGWAGQNAGSSQWELQMAYYFEFWNMGTKDILIDNDTSADNNSPDFDYLPTDTFIAVANQAGWADAGTAGGNNGTVDPWYIKPTTAADTSRNFKLRLKDFVNGSGEPMRFPAGQVTVVTTEPNPENYTGYFIADYNTARTFYRPGPNLTTTVSRPPHRYGSSHGSLPLASTTSPRYVSGFDNRPTIYLKTRNLEQTTPTGSPGYDYETEFFIGNAFGWVESQQSALAIRPSIFADSYGQKGTTTQFHVRGGALLGNINSPQTGLASFTYQIGDPRANNEQLRFTSSTDTSAYRTGLDVMRSTASQSAANAGNSYSLGRQNSHLVNPAGGSRQWDEANNTRTTSSLASGGSPAYYRNGAMASIGELGHVYDPARGIYSSGIDYAFGGGRTLRIGQSETRAGAGSQMAFWDGKENSASRGWAAWRLLDMFSTRDEVEDPHKSSTLGLINPNGALRDGGAAIRALLDGFRFSTNREVSDFTLQSGAEFSNADLTLFTSSLTNLIGGANGVPIFERGQLGELGYFNTNTLPSLSGTTLTNVNDRGREELFRRMAELVTTKGNTFSVYVVGQSVQKQANGTMKVTATTGRRVIVRLTPQYQSDLEFDPNDNQSVINRFASPTNYVINILSQMDQ